MSLYAPEIDDAPLWDEARAVAADFPPPGWVPPHRDLPPLPADQVPALVPSAARSLVEGLPPYVL